MSFVLATTDWKILPVAGVAITDEEREAAAGSGTVAELLFPLTGPVTQHHERKLFNQTKCDGNIMRTVDITIIERSLGAPVATRRR